MISAQLRRWFGRGPGRVTRADADRLLDGGPGGPVDPAHGGLADLLAAASGPARPRELVGERDAVAAFRREFRSTAPARRPRPRRRGLVVAALSAVLLAAGGTAYAATTGHLPDAVQRAVDGVFSGDGSQAPTSPAAGGPSGIGATPSGQPGGPEATQSAAVPGVPPGVDENRLKGLCRSWAAAQGNPHSNAISAEDLRVLAAAAGGEDRIEAYCAALTTPPGHASTKPGNPNPGNGRPTAPPGGGHTKGSK
jgi:hypothetical protein